MRNPGVRNPMMSAAAAANSPASSGLRFRKNIHTIRTNNGPTKLTDLLRTGTSLGSSAAGKP